MRTDANQGVAEVYGRNDTLSYHGKLHEGINVDQVLLKVNFAD